MPLKTELCDGRGKVIEQIVFASLLAAGAASPTPPSSRRSSTEGFRWLRQEPRSARGDGPRCRRRCGARCAAAGLPHDLARPADAARRRERGLAPGLSPTASPRCRCSSSARPNPVAAASSGPTQMGSSSAYSTSVDGHRVTVVGEVPPRTVQFIASQVRPQGAVADGAPQASPPPGCRRRRRRQPAVRARRRPPGLPRRRPSPASGSPAPRRRALAAAAWPSPPGG